MATLRELVQWNHRDATDLFLAEGRKTATALYTATAEIAPTREEIASDVRALGWKIPKWFHTGGARGWRFGRGKTTRDSGKKMTLEQVIAKVVRIRFNHSKFMATGWLPAILDLGGSTRSSKVDHSRGGATIARTPAEVKITMWNSTDGIEIMEAKDGFCARAFNARIADMQVYIARTTREAANAILRP